VTPPASATFHVGLAFLLGMGGQVLARHLRIPGIVVLLGLGVAAGPDGLGLLRADTLGAALPALVSFAVSIILFEGALVLDLREVRAQAGAIRRLVTIGAAITTIGGALAAHFALGWEGPLALLFGTLVIVTGPTVIQPILRRVRIDSDVGAVLEGEAILGDAVGATIAVVALELVLAPGHDALGSGLGGLAQRFAIGIAVGLVAGGLIAFGFKYQRAVPLEIRNAMALAIVVGSYQVADALVHESGILAVITAGLLVGNLPSGRRARRLHEFKEELTTLLLGLLFVLLAADVRLTEIRDLGWPGVVVVSALIFVVRPANVLVSTIGSELSWRQRSFLAWLAPRGIVAAAVASYFATVLDAQDIAGGSRLRALVFLVIAVTVTLQGSSAGWLARRLKIARPERSGWAVLGANGLALALAERLGKRAEVVLLDSSAQHCAEARRRGFRALEANALEDETLLRPEVEGRARFLAATPNDEVNFLFARRVRDVLRGGEIWLALRSDHAGVSPEMLEEMHARTLFGGERRLEIWVLRFERGLASVESRRAGESTVELPSLAPEQDSAAVLPLVVHRDDRVLPYPTDYRPRDGDRVEFAIFEERREEAERLLRESGWETAASESIADSGGLGTAGGDGPPQPA